MPDGPTIPDSRQVSIAAAESVLARSTGRAELTPKSSGPLPHEPTTLADERGPTSDLAVGALVGKYQLVQFIGGGGMGSVYLAFNPDLKCQVALKVISNGELARTDELRRFALECEALARFRHPHIVAIHDASQHQGRPFLVMEYLPGGSLAKNLHRFQSDPRAAVALIEKVARAVEHLHAGAVLHRDLKPANVLLDEAGEPRVSDFGLIKLLDSGDDLTRTGHRPGTPPYMAPEQTELASAALGPATDVWSLGVMLYELLLGRRPFVADERSSLFHQIATQEPERPRKLRPSLDPQLEAVVLRCLQKDPGKRFATAGELANDLAHWLRGEPTTTRPEGRLRRLSRALRRRPMVYTMLALALLAAVAVPVALHVADPDRPLHELQRTVARREPATVIGATGGPVWSSWFLGKTAKANLDRDGYFTVNAMDEFALLEVVRDLPVPEYCVRAKVRHNRTVQGWAGLVGIYLGGRGVNGAGETARLLFAMRYNGITDIGKEGQAAIGHLLPANAKIESGNPVSLEAFLHVTPDRAPAWGHGFGAAAGPRAKISGLGVDKWRNLLIVVRKGSLQASFDGDPLNGFDFADLHPFMQREFDSIIAKDPERRSYLRDLRPKFDPQGSLGLYVSEGSASFADLVITPLNPPGANP